MATHSGRPVAAGKPRLEAALSAQSGGSTVWFKIWASLSGGSLDSGYALTDRIIKLAHNTTAVTITATYTAGQTIILTQPTYGTLTLSPALETGATGYRPKTRVTITYTGDATHFVDEWTATTSVNAANNNIGYVLTDTTTDVVTVSVTETATVPATYRAVTVTTPDSSAITVTNVT